MGIRRYVAAAISFGLLLSTPTFATQTKPHITGIYSDLYYNEEGGDLLGTEIFIVYSGSEYVAFFQCWEGGSAGPTVSTVEVNGDAISFKVPAPSFGEGTYKGHITKKGFDGTWTRLLTNGTIVQGSVHLKRKLSYWQ